MVKITNGINVFEVSSGAFKSIFSRQGYKIVTEEKNDVRVENVQVDEVNEDEAFINEIEEKPISVWTNAEVKRYAVLKNIDISGTKSASEAKERIKAATEEE